MCRAVNAGILVAVLALSAAGCSTWDLPVTEKPVTMGSDGASGRIAIVYHPGGSAYPRRTVTRLAKELVSRGYAVTLSTAGLELRFEPDSCDALVLGSPVYGAEIRPPLKEFVSGRAPFSVPVFALLTGLFPRAFYDDYDLPNLTGFLAQAGVSLTAATKVGTFSTPRFIRRRIASLCDAIDAALGNE